MIRGTTPSFTFKLPFPVDMVANAKVTLLQGETMLEKKLCDCEASEDTLTVRLTQEETFLFQCTAFIKVQLRVVTTRGEALSTPVYDVFVKTCLDEEVLS